MNGGFKTFSLIIVLGCAGLGLVYLIKFQQLSANPTYGATFSPAYARYLGLSERQVFTAMLDDLPLRQVRLPIHWSDIQPEPGVTNFTAVDWYMDEAAKRNVDMVLAIGNKVPRWPECHTPDWAKDLSAAEYEAALLSYVEAIVTRYQVHPALERWQVENESLFVFGECPPPDYALVRREIARVKALDKTHQIQLTVSGEQQFWASVAFDADVIGTSMYRQVALPNGWQITFPIPPRWYAVQALSVGLLVDKVIISELQVEPWFSADYRTYTPAQAAELFTPRQLKANLEYAGNTGLKEVSLWGLEWWYYLKQNGQPELWEEGMKLLKTKN